MSARGMWLFYKGRVKTESSHLLNDKSRLIFQDLKLFLIARIPAFV